MRAIAAWAVRAVRHDLTKVPQGIHPGAYIGLMALSEQTFAIQTEALRVNRGGREVLHGVSLSLPAGQVIGLLGPSGGGKSTLIRSVMGVQVVESGAVTVLGEPAGAASLRSRIGYTTQSPSVYDDLSVGDNVRYFAAVMGMRGDALDAAVTAAIAAVDLTEKQNALVHNLSGGQRARVPLACAIVTKPDLLVLDEPTVGLDPVLRRDLWDLFHRLADGGSSLLVSSHVMDEASRCDHLVLMRDGHVIADCTPGELLERTGTGDAESAFLALIDELDDLDGLDGRGEGTA